jgi:carbohydrate kinase (thermoresistant glucokinase family)
MAVQPRAIVVMGVSGSGKTTVGRLLAPAIGATFLDADDLHSNAAVAKMASGEPLTDDDRQRWLKRVANQIRLQLEDGQSVVVACSALRRMYRDTIREEGEDETFFVHLDGSQQVIGDRLSLRTRHFMPASLLGTQLQTLEPLGVDEAGMTVGIRSSPNEIVAEVTHRLRGD